MPKRFADKWWEDLPDAAKTAAEVMGYDRASWNAGERVAYHKKNFSDLSDDEKRAAVFLGKDPLDYKLNIWWREIDENTKAHATVLGWDKRKWNEGWTTHDVECHGYWWEEAPEDVQEALEHFGYNQNLWDRSGEEEVFGAAAAKKKKKPVHSEEKKDDDAEEETDEEVTDDEDEEEESEQTDGKKDDQEATEGTSAPQKKRPTRKKPAKKKMGHNTKPNFKRFTQSELFGGGNGDSFDHGNNRHIDQISIYSDQSVVNGIALNYFGDKHVEEGTVAKTGAKTLKMRPGEFITSVKVRATRNVHSLTFVTNRGTSVGPCGGKKGTEVEVRAPDGCVLCGLVGKAGRNLNSVGFRWGPMPARKNSS